MLLVFIVKERRVSLVSTIYHCKTKASSPKCVDVRRERKSHGFDVRRESKSHDIGIHRERKTC